MDNLFLKIIGNEGVKRKIFTKVIQVSGRKTFLGVMKLYNISKRRELLEKLSQTVKLCNNEIKTMTVCL